MKLICLRCFTFLFLFFRILGSVHSRLSVLSRVQSGTRVDRSMSSNDGANNKRKQTLPLLFVNKRRKFPAGQSTKTTYYIGDIVLLPREWVKDSYNVSIPRKESRIILAQAGLLGKIEFESDMNGDEIIKEVCIGCSRLQWAFLHSLLNVVIDLSSVICNQQELVHVPCAVPLYPARLNGQGKWCQHLLKAVEAFTFWQRMIFLTCMV